MTALVCVPEPPLSPDARTSRALFAGDLAWLRREAGCPSYAQLYRLSPLLPPATISDVLNAKSAPRIEFVLAFVDAVGVYADRHGISLSATDRDPESWRRRWLRVHAVPTQNEDLELAIDLIHDAARLLRCSAHPVQIDSLRRARQLLDATLDELACR